MIRPHGGKLVNRIRTDSSGEPLNEFRSYPRISVQNDKMRDIENIATGVFSPLEGFNGEEDLKSILKDGRLSNWLPWTLPILLDVNEDVADDAYRSKDIVITEEGGAGLAIMNVEERFTMNKRELAKGIFLTDDPSHPGVQRTFTANDVFLGGKIELVKEGSNKDSQYGLDPVDTRDVFEKRGWETIVGFQTRNVPHLGHEYVQKTALNFTDGLFINPVIGKKKSGDFRDDVILGTYDVLVNFYFPRDRVLLGTLHTEMRYAGPREAIFHAIVRKNFGCTHFIVGRDHAGVGNFYDPYDSHKIFQDYTDLGILPLFFFAFFYCSKCASVATEKTCPHGEDTRSNFSGTLLRDVLQKKGDSALNLVRPEVLEVIQKWEDPFVK
ncbi:MAG: sulfate adenylyltransferase [Thaumarchaeota archaeon]|nr:sulfate adenylyltransferase [Nitrososphaerota archaeon]